MGTQVSVQNFQKIKEFVLANGDKQSYSNMYNNNPHYVFKTFHVFLEPEMGQMNMDCNPEISDFDEIVVQDENGFTYIVCRSGKVMYDKNHEKRIEGYFLEMLDYIKNYEKVRK